jgi:hypothetical protein
MGFFSFFKRKPSELETVTISRQDLRQKLIDLGFNGGWGYMDLSADPAYQMPTLEGLEQLIFDCPSDSYRYARHRRDCDDFARIFLGWLSQKGKGDYAIGWIKGWLIYTEKEVYHKMCWGMTQQGLYIFEPQNDRYIWKYGEPVNWPGAIEFKPNTMGI